MKDQNNPHQLQSVANTPKVISANCDIGKVRAEYAQRIADNAVPADRQDSDSGYWYHSNAAEHEHDAAYNEAVRDFNAALDMWRAAYATHGEDAAYDSLDGLDIDLAEKIQALNASVIESA